MGRRGARLRRGQAAWDGALRPHVDRGATIWRHRTMSSDPPPWLRSCWRRAWPACLFIGAAVFLWSLAAVGDTPGLRAYRVSEIATFWGIAFLIVAGLPLLAAWALWSALGIGHWAARLSLYAGFLVADFGLCAWLFFGTAGPQM